jgi:hypothetical protein
VVSGDDDANAFGEVSRYFRSREITSRGIRERGSQRIILSIASELSATLIPHGDELA